MKGRSSFTQGEVSQIRRLLMQKSIASGSAQKALRKQLRNLDFYISDFSSSSDGFICEDFDRLVSNGNITIISGPTSPSFSTSSPKHIVQNVSSTRDNSDEAYVLDLCDEILGDKCLRQHRFSFLLGDGGHGLPVDGYYPNIKIVVEYHERQHSESVPMFDKKSTISGVPRGVQRQLYDQRRREVLPKHGLKLIEISFSELTQDTNKRLKRDKIHDLQILRRKLVRLDKTE